jgi:hypothetical protein
MRAVTSVDSAGSGEGYGGRSLDLLDLLDQGEAGIGVHARAQATSSSWVGK